MADVRTSVVAVRGYQSQRGIQHHKECIWKVFVLIEYTLCEIEINSDAVF